MECLAYIGLALLGLCFGSFAGASVWRLRARQLTNDKKAGEKVDSKEYKKLKSLIGQKLNHDRSRCLHCQRQLAWYDLLPLVSWLSTRGKCRYCHKPIGWFEPLIELGLAAFFVLSFTLWPLPLDSPLMIAQFVLWLVSGVLLAILFAYDLKWFLLPDQIMILLYATSAVFAGIALYQADDLTISVLNLVGAVGVLSGIYFLLWLASKGGWIGFGDVKLGLVLGLLLGDWQTAFLGLFLANLIGCLIVIPGLVSGKLSRSTHVPFGPMLIGGCVIAFIFSGQIIGWYTSLVFTL